MYHYCSGGGSLLTFVCILLFTTSISLCWVVGFLVVYYLILFLLSGKMMLAMWCLSWELRIENYIQFSHLSSVLPLVGMEAWTHLNTRNAATSVATPDRLICRDEMCIGTYVLGITSSRLPVYKPTAVVRRLICNVLNTHTCLSPTTPPSHLHPS
jgi:hypothetical protein